MVRTPLTVGEPAPWFTGVCTNNPKFHFESVAGRYIVMCFLGSAASEASQRVLTDMRQHREVFDDHFCCFFGVSTDPNDEGRSHTQQELPGIRFFWDFDQAISQSFGVIDPQGTYHPCTYILDERLRVMAMIPMKPDAETHVAQWISILSQVPPFPTGHASVQAPILVVPRIFEPSLCQALIDHYNQHGGEESGFMRERGGQTVHVSDSSFKRRRDQEILDDDLLNAAMFRIHDRLAPEIHKAFQFRATRIERHIVACYDGTTGGFFRSHRDNTTKGTAHRRFAVSLNLNTGDYEGGMLRFPEFGQHTYEAPAGGAVVFSCSLLHEATPVTRGIRYAYLPFLYDDAAAKIRQRNRKFIQDDDDDESGRGSNQKKVDKPRGFQVSASKSRQKKR